MNGIIIHSQIYKIKRRIEMNYTPQTLAVEVKYLGATNNLGARVKLSSNLLKESITLNYDYSKNGVVEQAVELLESKGLVVASYMSIKDNYILSVEPVNGSFKFLEVLSND